MSPILSALLGLLIVVYLLLQLQRRNGYGGGDDRGHGPGSPKPNGPKGGQSLRVVEPSPVEAAGILMTRLARAGGPLTDEKRRVIAEQAQQYFDMDDEAAQRFTDHCANATAQVSEPAEQARRMTDVVLAKVGAKDLVDLDSMLVAVSEAEGLPTAEQLAVLQAFRDRSGITA